MTFKFKLKELDGSHVLALARGTRGHPDVGQIMLSRILVQEVFCLLLVDLEVVHELLLIIA